MEAALSALLFHRHATYAIGGQFRKRVQRFPMDGQSVKCGASDGPVMLALGQASLDCAGAADAFHGILDRVADGIDDSSEPVAVSGLNSGVTGISASSAHTCAVVSGGAKCWGSNTNGQLGNGETTSSSVPVAVTGLSSGVSHVVTGRLLTLARTTAGSVQGWGDNTYGLIANRPDSTWTRYITAIDGDMAATLTSTGQYRYTISNIRGDVVADADSNGLAQAVAIDEFGNPASNLPGDRRYGFMGDKQREALTPRGTVAMGVRLYVPGTGRFLQTDPVLGGSDNSYDYAGQDPVNGLDLDGRKKNKRPKKKCFSTTDSFSRNGAVVDITAQWCSRGKKIVGKPRNSISQRVKSGASIYVKTDGMGPVSEHLTSNKRTWVHKQSANFKSCDPIKAICPFTFYFRVEAYFHSNGKFSIKYDDSRPVGGEPVVHQGTGDPV